jgi:hypothetical protein
MNNLTKLYLICCLLSTCKQFGIITTAIKMESPLDSTQTLNASTLIVSSSLPSTSIEKNSGQVTMDLQSSNEVLLDPNIVLARFTRDTYNDWTQSQGFKNPYRRQPFNEQRYYDSYKPVKLNKVRRIINNIRRNEVIQKPFKVYPVFPG